MNKISLNEQAQEILRIAEKHGVEQNFFFLTTFNSNFGTNSNNTVEQNFFFLTTFKRYQVQIGILNDLEKTIREEHERICQRVKKRIFSPCSLGL